MSVRTASSQTSTERDYTDFSRCHHLRLQPEAKAKPSSFPLTYMSYRPTYLQQTNSRALTAAGIISEAMSLAKTFCVCPVLNCLPRRHRKYGEGTIDLGTEGYRDEPTKKKGDGPSGSSSKKKL